MICLPESTEGVALTKRCARLTQRLSLAGAQAYRATIEASFGPNLVAGMERSARELERADQEAY